VTTRHTPPGPPEPDEDPTGVRALLSSLPDPGPMPPDLVARISASIAAEHAARAAAGGSSGEHQSGHGTVVPLRRRSLWRTAGIAAAAAAVIGIGGASLLTGTSPSDVSALFGGSGSGADTAANAESSTAREGEALSDSGSGAAPRMTSPVGEVSVHHSGAAYTADGFAAQASRMLADPGETMAPMAAESPAIGPIGTEHGIRTCLVALGAEPSAVVTADLGTFDGAQAAVLVLTTDTGHTAYAVGRNCTEGESAVLAGPTRLP
jgi:hypothetical protein